MPSQTLSLSFRPKTFDDLVGQKHLTKMIRSQIESGRIPAAWMFSGGTGSGKTTTARIIALSLQCSHGEFGSPCESCQKSRSQFDIVEINAAEASGIAETEAVIKGAFYNPMPPSKYRVYIFDEAQNLSKPSMSALLKYFEDSPKTTVWMICTTEPTKILRTLRRRCKVYALEYLTIKALEVLVERALDYVESKLPSAPIVDALVDAGVFSPGFVMMALEAYLAGESPEKAAQVGLEAGVDTLRICRAVVKGDWEETRKLMLGATPEDARMVRASLGGYLKSMLLGAERSKKATVAAEAIQEMARLSTFEEGLQLAGTSAVLYNLCKRFE